MKTWQWLALVAVLTGGGVGLYFLLKKKTPSGTADLDWGDIGSQFDKAQAQGDIGAKAPMFSGGSPAWDAPEYKAQSAGLVAGIGYTGGGATPAASAEVFRGGVEPEYQEPSGPVYHEPPFMESASVSSPQMTPPPKETPGPAFSVIQPAPQLAVFRPAPTLAGSLAGFSMTIGGEL